MLQTLPTVMLRRFRWTQRRASNKPSPT